MYTTYDHKELIDAPDGFYWKVSDIYKTVIQKRGNIITSSNWSFFVDLNHYHPGPNTLFYGPIPAP